MKSILVRMSSKSFRIPRAVRKRNSSPSRQNTSQMRQAKSKGKDLLYKVKILGRDGISGLGSNKALHNILSPHLLHTVEDTGLNSLRMPIYILHKTALQYPCVIKCEYSYWITPTCGRRPSITYYVLAVTGAAYWV